MLGPAFVAAVAYVDPGNFATNLAMLAAAAKLFHGSGLIGVSTIEGAHAKLGHLVGGGATLAFAVVPLVILTGRRDVMGAHVNGIAVSALAYVIAAAITAMNLVLVGSQLLG